MIVEYIRYTIPADRAAAFEQAYADAGKVLAADGHCLAYEVGRGAEQPEHFTVRIEWDSLEGHEQGFRHSPDFPAFLTAVRPFFALIDEMKHYEVGDAWRRTADVPAIPAADTGAGTDVTDAAPDRR